MAYIVAITPSRREALRSLKLDHSMVDSYPRGPIYTEYAQGILTLCKNVRELEVCEGSYWGSYREPKDFVKVILQLMHLLPALEKVKVSGHYYNTWQGNWEAIITKANLDFQLFGTRCSHYSRNLLKQSATLQLNEPWMALRQERARPAQSKIKRMINKEFAQAPLHIFGEGRCGPDPKPQFLSSRTRQRCATALTKRGIPRSGVASNTRSEREISDRFALLDYRLARDGSLQLKLFDRFRGFHTHWTRHRMRSSGSWKSLKTVLRPEASDTETYRVALWICRSIKCIMSVRRWRQPRPLPPNPRHLSEAIKDLAWEDRRRETIVLERVSKLEEKWRLLYGEFQTKQAKRRG